MVVVVLLFLEEEFEDSNMENILSYTCVGSAQAWVCIG